MWAERLDYGLELGINLVHSASSRSAPDMIHMVTASVSTGVRSLTPPACSLALQGAAGAHTTPLSRTKYSTCSAQRPRSCAAYPPQPLCCVGPFDVRGRRSGADHRTYTVVSSVQDTGERRDQEDRLAAEPAAAPRCRAAAAAAVRLDPTGAAGQDVIWRIGQCRCVVPKSRWITCTCTWRPTIVASSSRHRRLSPHPRLGRTWPALRGALAAL